MPLPDDDCSYLTVNVSTRRKSARPDGVHLYLTEGASNRRKRLYLPVIDLTTDNLNEFTVLDDTYASI